MIYVWKEPENTVNRDIGEYDQESSSDPFFLRRGRIITDKEFSSFPIILETAVEICNNKGHPFEIRLANEFARNNHSPKW